MVGRFRAAVIVAPLIAAGLSVKAAPLNPTSSAPSPAVDASPVVATIDGEAIRADEVAAEIPDLHALDGTDPNLLARRALQQIIYRRMLIRRLGDATMRVSDAASGPERRRQELAFLLTCFKQRAASVAPATPGEVAAYMARNPNAFANRWSYRVDQLRLHIQRSELPKLRVLEPDHTLQDAMVHLTSQGIAFDRTNTHLDTADLEPKIADGIDELPAGEPFVIQDKGSVTVSVVLGRDAVQETPSETYRRAVLAATRERDFALLFEMARSEQARAKITYATGFEPAASTAP